MAHRKTCISQIDHLQIPKTQEDYAAFYNFSILWKQKYIPCFDSLIMWAPIHNCLLYITVDKGCYTLTRCQGWQNTDKIDSLKQFWNVDVILPKNREIKMTPKVSCSNLCSLKISKQFFK